MGGNGKGKEKEKEKEKEKNESRRRLVGTERESSYADHLDPLSLRTYHPRNEFIPM